MDHDYAMHAGNSWLKDQQQAGRECLQLQRANLLPSATRSPEGIARLMPLDKDAESMLCALYQRL